MSWSNHNTRISNPGSDRVRSFRRGSIPVADKTGLLVESGVSEQDLRDLGVLADYVNREVGAVKKIREEDAHKVTEAIERLKDEDEALQDRLANVANAVGNRMEQLEAQIGVQVRRVDSLKVVDDLRMLSRRMDVMGRAVDSKISLALDRAERFSEAKVKEVKAHTYTELQRAHMERIHDRSTVYTLKWLIGLSYTFNLILVGYTIWSVFG